MLNRIKRWLRSNLWIVLFDIIAVNGAYLLALLIRFYVHFRFTSAIGDFREYYLQFTPYYTVICLVVFYMCGLYNGMWRYAGLDDMNRIILANVITAAVQFFGTRLFVGRMPTSYYLIGSLLQFVMVVAIRFANRFLYVRRQRGEKLKTWSIPAMVVGSGDTGMEFTRYLESNSPFQVVVMVGEHSGKTMDGIPLVDYSSIPSQIQYHGITTLFIADESLSQARREEIRQAAKGIEVRDYLEYLSALPGCMPMGTLLGIVEGPVTVTVDGVDRSFSNIQECKSALGDGYIVRGIHGAKLELEKAS
jgi:FlaA1/EpsC-like NDP-sugar epimerase